MGQVNEEKDLGVLVDNELKFHKTLPLLYTSLGRPHLEYGNLVWGPFFKADSIAVERVQRRATKFVQPIKDLSYEERLRNLNLPSLLHTEEGEI